MTSPPPRVLVADDQPDVVAALRLLLRGEGFDADTAASVDEVRGRLSSQPYDLLLLDLNYARDTTSGREGLDLLAEVHARDDRLPIVVMTGWGTIDTAVEAMRRGARSFVHKPWDNAALTETVRREVADGIARREADIGARREREDAQRIQRALLPVTLPRLPWCEVAAAWMPASAFGGDCYDVIPLGSDRLGIAIADVAGKGLPAALLMSNLQATVRAFADVDASPADLATRTNRSLCRNGRVGRFVTFFYCVADAAARTLTFCNAGHNAPVLVRSDGSVERLAGGGMILGVFDDARYTQGEVAWREGDRLVLFTDGITEALPLRQAGGDDRRVDDEDFGDERLVGVVAAARHLPPQGLVDEVVADVLRFAGPALADDATVVCAAFSCATAKQIRPTTGHRLAGGPSAATGNR
jgi:sigma-B regulation protein RsbU (phosphoserine phosphatase)